MPNSRPTLDTLFSDAVAISDPVARAAFLDQAAGFERELRRRVDALLVAHFRAGDFLEPTEKSRDDTVAFSQPTESFLGTIGDGIGEAIGPYRLLEVIGEGGMGTVFMAEQTEPVRRKVALKLIKPGMDSKPVVARFEAERQALALMEHPHIARVFDGGATPSGRPYFVMELVRGMPVTDYCDQARLTVPERLGLFVQLCRAVQHAHQKGVIHRDIKPSNVMVTVIDGNPVPKVIDFGIAKATGAALTDRTLFTGFHQLVGTPLYMSPEQAELSGVDVDTRADVYSLGVLLYELLTGTTPFSPETFRTAGFDEMRRIIREDEPDRPSRRVSTLAAEHSSTIAERRKIDPRRLDRLMRNELDWVVMRALEKDRNRRYDGAGALAEDVERYLADEPIHAAPPTVGYRLRTFARRNRRPLTAGALVAITVLTVSGSLVWGKWDRATRKNVAESTATAALTESADHYRADRPAAAMAAAQRAVDTLRDIAGSESLLTDARGRVNDLAMAERLENLSFLGLEQGQQKATEVDAVALQAAFREYGIDPSESTEEEVAGRIRERLILPDLVEGLDQWASSRRVRDGLDDPFAARFLRIASAVDPDPWGRRVRELRTAGTPEQVVSLAAEIPVGEASPNAVRHLALALERHGRRKEGLNLLRKAARRNPDRFDITLALSDFLRSARDESSHQEALRYLQAALAVRPRSALIKDRIGALLTEGMDRSAEGEEWFRDALLLKPDFHLARMNLSVALGKQGKYADALAHIREVLTVLPYTSTAYQHGLTLGRLGRPDEAAAAYREAVGYEPRDAQDFFWRGLALVQLGRTADAAEAFRGSIRMRPSSLNAYVQLGQVLTQRGEDADALTVYKQGLRIDPDYALLHSRIGILLRKLRRFEEALSETRMALRFSPNNHVYHFNLGNLLIDLQRVPDAAAAYRRATEIKLDYAAAHYGLGRALAKTDRPDEAVEAYQRAIAASPQLAEAHCNLADQLLRQGRYKESLASYRRGHELGSKQANWGYPSAAWVETAERVVGLESRLSALLAGTEIPTDPADAAAVAQVAASQKRFARAVELYRQALAAKVSRDRRYDAACAAARAGGGHGQDADQFDEPTRVKYRAQALAWLRDELTERMKVLTTGTASARQMAQNRVRDWLSDKDLTGVRDASELAKRTEAERAEWTRFWAEIRTASETPVADRTEGKEPNPKNRSNP